MILRTDKVFLRWVIVVMLAGILVTRWITLDHGMMLQPDEYIFYYSSSSLINGEGYTPEKTYPEGSFILQAPFQALRIFLDSAIGLTVTDQEAGRIASVFYFSIGSSLGCYLMFRLSKKRRAVILYSIIIVFALFQIEQSRYGTGDPPSFFLMMLSLFMLERFLQSKRNLFLYISAAVIGVMGAVKYPQLYFLLLPILAVFGQKCITLPKRIKMVVIIILLAFVGFLCFSPLILSPGYLVKLLSEETSAYINKPNLWAVGTPFGHLMNLLLLHLFYSDVPLAIVFIIIGLFTLRGSALQADYRSFFIKTVPIIFGVFYLYNLFIPSLFFRTYYIYFCISVLYTAIGLDVVFRKKWFRIVPIALVVFMVARGAYLIGILAQEEKRIPDHLETHDLWYNKAAVFILGSNFIPGHEINGTVTKVSTDRVFLSYEPDFEAGVYVVTQPYQFALARSGVFPITNKDVQTISEKWKEFLEYYDLYLYVKQYPDYYYYLFGYWLEGSTGTTYEFPTIYYFYIQ